TEYGQILYCNSLCRQKPPLQIPAALRITDNNEARLIESNGPKFKMAAQQAQQTQIGAQVFGAQKVFIAEGRVLSDGYTVGIQLRTGQNPRVETLDFHLPTKR